MLLRIDRDCISKVNDRLVEAVTLAVLLPFDNFDISAGRRDLYNMETFIS